MRELIAGIGDAAGSVVYLVVYPPIFVGWHLVGRHVAKATRHVLENSRSHEAELLIETHGDVSILKEMLCRAYYNALRREAQDNMIRSA